MRRTESPKRRSLATWVFRTVGITSLALGVGANSAIFSVTSSLWLRHRGILEPSAVGTVLFRPTVGTDGALMPSATMRECRVLESMASASVAFEVYARSADSRWMNPTVTLATGEHLRTTTVSHAYFIVLGVGLRGQGFQPEDDLSDRRVAVASQQFASTHFPSQTEVVGHTVATRQGDVTIIGVAPREFLGTRLGDATDLWIPLGALSSFSAAPEDARAFIPLAPIVRLRPSGSWRAVQTELDQLTHGRALAFSLASLQFAPAPASSGAAHNGHHGADGDRAQPVRSPDGTNGFPPVGGCGSAGLGGVTDTHRQGVFSRCR
jgi:MacB-like periplasmic core domain